MDWKELIAIAAGHGKAAGLTQTEIARRTGAHQKQISQLEAVGIDFVLIARDKGHKTDEK